jgi:hypothetical protein
MNQHVFVYVAEMGIRQSYMDFVWRLIPVRYSPKCHDSNRTDVLVFVDFIVDVVIFVYINPVFSNRR